MVVKLSFLCLNGLGSFSYVGEVILVLLLSTVGELYAD